MPPTRPEPPEPAPFTDDRPGLVPDGRLRVVVEKTGPDIYSVTAEAEVGRAAEAPDGDIGPVVPPPSNPVTKRGAKKLPQA